MNFIEFTPIVFEKFIQSYTNAVVEQKELFEFQGQLFPTDYARYLIEYQTKKITQNK